MDARTLVPLLDRERPRFVRLARRLLPTSADADDVVQQAMIRSAARAGSLDDPARVRSWFGRILRRAIADFYRSPRRDVPTDSRDLDAAVAPAELVANPCHCSIHLLDTLRPGHAEVLRRIDFEDQSSEEAARALGISVGNLHVRLHRARRALRERVMAHCGVASCGPCLDCTCHAGHRCGTAV